MLCMCVCVGGGGEGGGVALGVCDCRNVVVSEITVVMEQCHSGTMEIRRIYSTPVAE